jgi:hypothetical protein
MKFLFIILFLISASVGATTWQAKGSGQLVELYTSEGCSSCPDADQWISGLKSNSTLWTNFVPLSFHVNYWDNLGWPDKFASHESTKRQREYAKSWNTGRIYTPEIVIQGKEASKTFEFQTVPEFLEAKWDGKQLSLNGSKIPEKTTIHFAWLGLNIQSAVKRGENAGKILNHEFVVLKFGTLGIYNSNLKYDLSLPAVLPAEAKALAIWLEKDHRPIVAVGSPI